MQMRFLKVENLKSMNLNEQQMRAKMYLLKLVWFLKMG